MTTKDQVAQLIVAEAKARGYSRDECLAEMSCLYQESGWNETIWDSAKHPAASPNTPHSAWPPSCIWPATAATHSAVSASPGTPVNPLSAQWLPRRVSR